MKKFLVLIIAIFLFSTNTYALSTINSMDINVEISNDGIASVVEAWQVSSHNNTYFEKEFYESSKATIYDLNITDSNESSYNKVEKFDKSKNLTFNLDEKDKNKKLRFTTNGREATVNIAYKVSGMITKFDDVEAIDWYFLSLPSSIDVKVLNIYISGPVEFNATNMALYGIGNNVTTEFVDGKIHITSSDIKKNSKIKLMASISDYKFANYKTIKGTLVENYEEILSSTTLIGNVKKVINNTLVIALSVITLGFLIFFIVIKFIRRNKISNDFRKIKSYNNENTVDELNKVPYYDSLPCDNNLYKIYFIANYYNIIKHRSSLIGAIIFKWIMDGIIKLKVDEKSCSLVLKDKIKFKSELDQELYDILKSASNNLVLDNSKLIRYATKNVEKVIKWYDNIIRTVIKDEYDKGNVKVKGKKIILNKKIYNEAINIQGLKRYLLNFNQVPRKNELTETVYKGLLEASILLRVDENLYQEILRKSPDNINAMELEKFSKVKPIYTNIYSKVYEEFKKQKIKRDINIYNPENNV